MTVITPAAAWMDRLSDRVGTLVPGLRFLSPRHPFKVSLVMGLLGWIARWLICVCFLGVRYLPDWIVVSRFALIPICGILLIPGIVVLIPLCLWGGTRFLTSMCSLFPAILPCPLMWIWSGYAHQQLWIPTPIPTWESFWFFVGPIALPAASHAISVALILRRNAAAVLVTTSIWCSLVGASLLEWIIFLKLAVTQGLSGVFTSGMFFTMCLTILAMCLGIAIWDETPPPKFESEEDVTGDESP